MQLDYDTLVHDYTESLHTTLRRFRPGPDFLDLWVHDEDHNRSLFGIFEAAEGGGLKSLEVRVSPAVATTLNRAWLQEELQQLGKTTLLDNPDALVVRLEFNSKKG